MKYLLLPLTLLFTSIGFSTELDCSVVNHESTDGKKRNYIDVAFAKESRYSHYMLYASKKKNSNFKEVKHFQIVDLDNGFAFYGVFFFGMQGPIFLRVKGITDEGVFSDFTKPCIVVYPGL